MTTPTAANRQPADPADHSAPGWYPNYVLAVFVVVYVFNFLDQQILSILNEHIKADLGLTDAQLGFLFGTTFAVFYAGVGSGRLVAAIRRLRDDAATYPRTNPRG